MRRGEGRAEESECSFGGGVQQLQHPRRDSVLHRGPLVSERREMVVLPWRRRCSARGWILSCQPLRERSACDLRIRDRLWRGDGWYHELAADGRRAIPEYGLRSCGLSADHSLLYDRQWLRQCDSDSVAALPVLLQDKTFQ